MTGYVDGVIRKFVFLDHGLCLCDEDFLSGDCLCLMKTGKNVFSDNLANLIKKALN